MRKGEMIDQMDFVLKELKRNPYSRRIMTNMYIPQYLDGGHLEPCCFLVMYNVTKDKNGANVLNMSVIQRSQDMLLFFRFGIRIIMVHQINDAHIYDRHVPMIKELLTREEYPAPHVSLNPDVKDFYAFTTDDLIVENYQHGPQIKNIPIAVQVSR